MRNLSRRVLFLLSTGTAVAAAALVAAAQAPQTTPAPTTQAARPQRTEAEARALADKHRAERARLRKKTGKPVELISDYVAAQFLPGAGVARRRARSTRSTPTPQGIPVSSSEKVPDAALLVARDIVNTHAGDAARPAQGDDRAQVADRRHRRSRDDDGHPGVRAA